MPKVIAFYLPQFHEIPENNAWWGEGFTEWVNVKKAVPEYEGHNQPRVPLNNNYYDLADAENMRWQAKLAKDHGLFGFAFYHYWFDGKLLLEKPVEAYLKETTIDFPFCLSWANEHWTNQWVSSDNNVLMEQRYGTEKDWIEHFNYFLPFFKDERYIKKDGKPLIIIYRPELIDCRKEMIECWRRLARENGFPDIWVVAQRVDMILNTPNEDRSMIDNFIEYQPGTVFVTNGRKNPTIAKLKQLKRQCDYFIEKHLPMLNNIHFDSKNAAKKGPTVMSYEKIWQDVLDTPPVADNCIPCAFVDWDNTPRKHDRGQVLHGACPEAFGKYFPMLLKKAEDVYHTDYVFIFAWNEWAEGGYLEPDTKNGFGYLEKIKKSLEE